MKVPNTSASTKFAPGLIAAKLIGEPEELNLLHDDANGEVLQQQARIASDPL
jgi:hypothetical protein